MDDTKRIIIPDLPENLRTLFEQEEKNLKESVAKIFSYSSLEDHLKIIYKSLNIIFDFTISYKNQNRVTLFGNALDHVFYRQLELISHDTIKVTSSDHNPIKVSFKTVESTFTWRK